MLTSCLQEIEKSNLFFKINHFNPRAKPLQYFNKLVPFQMSKKYFFLYEDAYHMHKLLDLKINFWGKVPISWCFEERLAQNTSKILSSGFKLVFVDQLELSINKTNQSKLLKRDVCKIITKGTYTEYNELEYNSKFLLVIFQ